MPSKRQKRNPLGLKKGDKIILSRGKGRKKRKFNGETALVAELPANGSWMTVIVGSRSIKWRKGGCKRAKMMETCPISSLSDELLVSILSFLGGPARATGGGPESLLFVRDAARLHATISSVCRRWKSLCDRESASILGLLNVNLNALQPKHAIPSVKWMCLHQVALGALNFTADWAEVLLIASLLRVCDTGQLSQLRAHINGGYRLGRTSAWIASAYEELEGSAGLVDLTQPGGTPSLTEMATALAVPINPMSQVAFHDLVAAECPNITKLSVTLELPVVRTRSSDYISSSLFSIATISELEVCLMVCERGIDDVDGNIFSKLIERLSGLQKLVLKTGGASRFRYLFYKKLFHIESPSLLSLDVSPFPKGVWVSCRCPQLEYFRCCGSVFGNGTRPIPLDDQERALIDQNLDNEGTLRLHAGEIEFFRLNVPDSCLCVLENFCGQDAWITGQMQNAVYSPWSD